LVNQRRDHYRVIQLPTPVNYTFNCCFGGTSRPPGTQTF